MSTEDLDDIIFRFHQAAEPLTPELVGDWVGRYPQFADDIRAHAVEIVDMRFLAGQDAGDEAAPADEPATPVAGTTLRAVAKAAGTSLRDLADDLGIARSIVSDLNTATIETASVRGRFVRLASERLGVTMEWLSTVLAGPGEASVGAAFKAEGMPGVGRRRTWEEAVRDSDMDAGRKAFWTAEER
ncbi:helix-turn-helix domain-containing protein [Methylobacterium sp. J-092]|uniref:helix-turn-helix domain-containing protein n=1 Tax=Methylobacterium sp. J-092 TaxID=2836667 RepID=UPI001FB9DC72|nr:helix-turn-helix transcriptional regulator [Methylobacterium sp. J-092]MCJ2007048.1 helix-turn-helix domain-containing protein [Methylobacterium sp. J-092]